MSRALVLSGGGSVGVAWETGVVLGLLEGGVDLTAADLVVGTSAGSTVGAQVALGHDLRARVEQYRTAAQRGSGETTGSVSVERLAGLAELFNADDLTDDARMKRIGQAALAAETFPEEVWRANFAQFADAAWPEGYACTAIEAVTGEFQVWDAAAGVPLDAAVASSCALPCVFPLITINGRRYYDGGFRSSTNADLAVGYDKVLIVIVMVVPPGTERDDPRVARFMARFPDEEKLLADSGSQVESILPDEAAATVMGVNLLDPSVMPAAVDAGIRQGKSAAASLVDFWT